ncbi:MAG TPA: DUF2332 domain-containing protein [Propioniciclava tarda]|nr:DUF2332 domain-containing protein [Propioniciclava tarda]
MRTVHAFERQPIDELYRWFASEAEPTSPIWGRLCRWIAEHPEVSDRLDRLPGVKRQPNVFLAALKYWGGPLEPGPEFVDWVDAQWPELESLILSRATQTNEPGRCAVLAPVLASLPQPITLLEIGSSAGLCLLPDRYRYRYASSPSSVDAEATHGPAVAGAHRELGRRPPSTNSQQSAQAGQTTGLYTELPLRETNGEMRLTGSNRQVGLQGLGGAVGLQGPDRQVRLQGPAGEVGLPGLDRVVQPAAASEDAPVLDCRVTGTPPGDPSDLVIAARRGLDLSPLNPADADDARWLRALVWPGEDAREARLAACLALAAADPPPVLVGDLRHGLDALLAGVAPGTTPVLQHSAVLSYLPRADRDAFERAVTASGIHWLSYEGPSVVTSVKAKLTDRDRWEKTPNFVVALDGAPIARASAHGGWVHWSS